MTYTYKLNCGQYVLHQDDKPIGPLLDEVSIAFDKESGTLHKHGDPDMVSQWLTHAQDKFRTGGFPEMAEDLVMLTGRFTLADLNKCLSHSGYIGTMYHQLNKGALAVLTLAGDARPLAT